MQTNTVFRVVRRCAQGFYILIDQVGKYIHKDGTPMMNSMPLFLNEDMPLSPEFCIIV